MPISLKHLHLASQPKIQLIVPIEHKICWQFSSTQIIYFYPSSFYSHLIMQYMCKINFVKWKDAFLFFFLNEQNQVFWTGFTGPRAHRLLSRHFTFLLAWNIRRLTWKYTNLLCIIFKAYSQCLFTLLGTLIQ